MTTRTTKPTTTETTLYCDDCGAEGGIEQPSGFYSCAACAREERACQARLDETQAQEQADLVDLELARAANAHNNREPELVEAHLACALAHAAGDDRLVNNIEAARADLVQLAERLARNDELTAVSFAADQAERDGHPILAANLRRACTRLERLMRADKV